MAPKWYDSDRVQRDGQWAAEKYGVKFLDAGQGKKFALTEVREVTDGNVNVVVNVFNEASGPQYEQPIAQSWPTLESPDGGLKLCEGSQSCWSGRCMVVDTDGNGVARFTFGSSGIIGGNGGPFAYWVLSPSLKSDGLAQVGWLGGTNHHGMLHLVFRITDDPDPDPPIPPIPPTPPGDQLQRVLDKAEGAADSLLDNDQFTEAGAILVILANVLANLAVSAELCANKEKDCCPGASK